MDTHMGNLVVYNDLIVCFTNAMDSISIALKFAQFLREHHRGSS
jgi:hypothetical protein